MSRPWTPDVVNPETGARTIKVKRACNGCGTVIGDVSPFEMEVVMAGFELPDVRGECPTCTPDGVPLLAAGWCWCADVWLIGGLADFREGGKLHTREGCWPRDRASRVHGLPAALGTTYRCCEHCPCVGMDHVVPCPVDGCAGGIGS